MGLVMENKMMTDKKEEKHLIHCAYCLSEDVDYSLGNGDIHFCSRECIEVNNLSAYFLVAIIGVVFGGALFMTPPVALKLLGLVFFGIGLFYLTKARNSLRYYGEKSADRAKRAHLLEEEDDPLRTMEFIEIPELGETYNVCCYQTARLGDQYCACGRAVDQKLIDFMDVSELQ